MLEPMDEPVSTMGASSPTDPPKPTVSELATMLDQVLCTFMCPLRLEMEKRIIQQYKENDEIVPGTEISVGTTLTIR